MVKKQAFITRKTQKRKSTPKKKKSTSVLPKKKKSMPKKKKKKSMPKKKKKKSMPKKKKKKSTPKKKKKKKSTPKKKKSMPKKKKKKSVQKKSESIVKNQGINYEIKPLVKKEESIICNIVTPNGDKVILPSEFDARWTYDNLMDRKQRFSYYDNLENMVHLRNKYNEYRAICY